MIPRLANGGIIKNEITNNYEEFSPEIAFPLNDKYYRIYKRTKNKRIKKKNMKKSFRAMIEEQVRSFNKKIGLSIYCNGIPITRE